MLATGHYLAITRTPGPAQAPPEARLPTQPPHTDISWWLEAVTTGGGLWLTLSHVSPGIAHFALCPLSPPPLSSSPAERKPPLPPPPSPQARPIVADVWRGRGRAVLSGPSSRSAGTGPTLLAARIARVFLCQRELGAW